MKVIALTILFSVLSLTVCIAQGDGVDDPRYSERYTLDLPDLWKGKSGLLRELNDILPIFIDKLKGKKFCVDCDAGYRVKLTIGSMQELDRSYVKIGALGSYEADIRFVFRGTLLVTNAAQKPLLNFVLIDTLDLQKTHRPFKVPVKNVNKINSEPLETKKNTKNLPVYILNEKMEEEVGTPQEIFAKLPSPTPFEMYTILEHRIHDIHVMLKKQGKLL